METRKNEIVNRLNKTKTEQTPDLKGAVTCVLLLKEIDLFITAEQKSSLRFSLFWLFDLGFLLSFVGILSALCEVLHLEAEASCVCGFL